MKVEVDLDIMDVIDNIERENAFEAIRQIDLKMADSDFTNSVIRYLIDDMTSELGIDKETFVREYLYES